MVKSDALTIGVDIGASKVYAVSVKNGRVLHGHKNYFVNRQKSHVLDTIVSAIASVARDGKIGKIGLGMPCIVAGGKPKRCFNIPVLEKIELKKLLEKKYGAQVVVANDTKAMLRYELSQNPELRKKRVLFIAWGTGIGSAFADNGKIHEGSRGLAGEIGHSIISAVDRRSLEDFAAGRVYQPKGKSLWLQDLLKNKNSPRVRKIFNEMGHGLGIGILNAIYHYDPDIIIIGGGLYRFLPYTLPHIRRALLENSLIPETSKIKIRRSGATEDAGVLGAVLY